MIIELTGGEPSGETCLNDSLLPVRETGVEMALFPECVRDKLAAAFLRNESVRLSGIFRTSVGFFVSGVTWCDDGVLRGTRLRLNRRMLTRAGAQACLQCQALLHATLLPATRATVPVESR